MVGRGTLVAIATLLGFATAHADGIYVAGPVFGGNKANGGIFVCRIFNPTTKAVNIKSGQIWTDTANPDATDQCKGMLKSFHSCTFSVGNCCSFSYNCRIVVEDTGPNHWCRRIPRPPSRRYRI